jgi:SAM-dependent methyltransferase
MNQDGNTLVKDEEIQQRLKQAYEDNIVYKRETISLKPGAGSDYADRLLTVRLDMVRQYSSGGRLVDLCCGSGEHLFALDGLAAEYVGIDFSENFIAHAKADPRCGAGIRFLVGDARAMPIEDASVDLLFSFSSLYVIPQVEEVFADIMRVLKPGSRCILDLGNSRSLNQIVVRAYPEIPPTSMQPIGLMRDKLSAAGLRIIEHRRFQILPLWADKPCWLSPLLHPRWKEIMKTWVGGRLLDERLSSLPLLRHFAFRHIIVCEKPLQTDSLSDRYRGGLEKK